MGLFPAVNYYLQHGLAVLIPVKISYFYFLSLLLWDRYLILPTY